MRMFIQICNLFAQLFGIRFDTIQIKFFTKIYYSFILSKYTALTSIKKLFCNILHISRLLNLTILFYDYDTHSGYFTENVKSLDPFIN